MCMNYYLFSHYYRRVDAANLTLSYTKFAQYKRELKISYPKDKVISIN
jgi:hypothetical protein